VVRQRFAKPLYAGSNPVLTSPRKQADPRFFDPAPLLPADDSADDSPEGPARPVVKPEPPAAPAPAAEPREPLAAPCAPAAGSPANPRAAVLARLARDLGELAAAGDLDGARIVHETIGRLLVPPGGGGEGAQVIDLAAERDRRGR
jgi:hypothetical protein